MPPNSTVVPTLPVKVFDDHNVDTPHILKNYKEVLMKMYVEGTIEASRPFGKPIRKNTFPNDVVVTFPED